MDQPTGGFLPRHTSMPPREQRTPCGDVTLTSRWARDRYYLVATGPLAAVQWLFPKASPEKVSAGSYRHLFRPGPTPITVERDLRKVCGAWQNVWDERLQKHRESPVKITKPEEPPSTLKQVFDFHQRHYAAEKAQSTQWKYPEHMHHWFDLLGEEILLANLSTELLLEARKRLRTEKGLADSTVNSRFATLKKMLNLARTKGWIDQDCWSEIEDLKVVRPPTNHWSKAEVAMAFQAAAEDEHSRIATLMLVLGVHLGLRKNEAVNVRWVDFDLDRVHPTTGQPSPVLRIQQREDFKTKTYENRIIPISVEAKRLLLENRIEGTEFVLQPQRDWLKKRGGTKRVYRYDPLKVWLRVRRGALERGAKHITFHEMRSTFASLCLQAGRSAEEVARWLGHRDTRMVREHYAHLIEFDQAPDLTFL